MGFKIIPAKLEDVEEIAGIMLAVSTSPRILLEFGNSNREEWLDWNVQCTRSEIEAAESWGEGEVSAVVAVDENEEE